MSSCFSRSSYVAGDEQEESLTCFCVQKELWTYLNTVDSTAAAHCSRVSFAFTDVSDAPKPFSSLETQQRTLHTRGRSNMWPFLPEGSFSDEHLLGNIYLS